MGAPVVHFDLYGKDAAALQEFYEKAFDWHVDTNNPMNYGLVDTGAGSGINGGISSNEHMDNGTIVYIEAHDPQAMLDKVVSLGGEVVMPVMEGPITLALFKDPAGNVVGLVKTQGMPSIR